MGIELLICVWVCVCGYSPALQQHLPFIACHDYVAAIDGNIQGKKYLMPSCPLVRLCKLPISVYFLMAKPKEKEMQEWGALVPLHRL